MEVRYIVERPRPQYGFAQFVGDVFLTVVTCGIWLVYKLFKFISR